MKFGRPRGMRDFLPAEMRGRRMILDSVRRVFECHGFEEMDTPAIEMWEVLAAKGGEEVERQIYKFQDKGGRWLGLRFDLTVPLARVVASNPDLTKPFKRYCIAKVWRYEEPQSGRFREFVQADIDIVGSPKMEADMECVSTAVDALRGIGLSGFEVKINNRKILEGIVEGLGIDSVRAGKVFRALDRLEKVGADAVAAEMAGAGLSDREAGRILDFTEHKGSEALDYVKSELAGSKAAMEGLQEIERILSLAPPFGLSGTLEVDFSLVRGLDYYTGPVFEIKAKDAQIGSIGGGGRYDRLIERFGGAPTPATGISLGIERLNEVLAAKLGSGAGGPTVFVANVNESVMADAIRISREIASKGIPSEADIMGRRLGRQLEYAEKRGIPYVLIVGPEELKSGKFKLRDMGRKGEVEVLLGDLPSLLLKR